MSAAGRSASIGSLLIFSDDWGRHPSSCQHLTRHLLKRYPVTWVNTIGTRAPKLDWQTARRVREKLAHWCVRTNGTAPQPSVISSAVLEPTVVSPRMWPWFSQSSDRKLNRWLLERQLSPVVSAMPKPVVAITTLPITADLPGRLPVKQWVYYCVDDFSTWPGLDGKTLRRMDRDMIQHADSVITVSRHLQEMIATEGRAAELMTHGVDLDFWRDPGTQAPVPKPLQALLSSNIPFVVFWGVVDRRMDSPTLQLLSQNIGQAKIVLVGPQQDPDPAPLSLENVVTISSQSMASLPAIAHRASVLIMPYADQPVTRAMQPLKLKEYLATGKPVVVNHLPSTEAWSDCLDNAYSPEEFSSLVLWRMRTGTPVSQQQNRLRLADESWSAKAQLFEQHIVTQSLFRHESLSLRFPLTQVVKESQHI